MKMKAVVLAGILLAAMPALAHHSFAMFDLTKSMTFVGTVEDYRWTNPHVHMTIKVPPGAADPTTVGIWDVEGGSVNIMMRQGWTKITFKPGDSINLVGHPMKDGSKGISLFYVQLPDGTKLYHDIARPGSAPSGANQ